MTKEFWAYSSQKCHTTMTSVFYFKKFNKKSSTQKNHYFLFKNFNEDVPWTFYWIFQFRNTRNSNAEKNWKQCKIYINAMHFCYHSWKTNKMENSINFLNNSTINHQPFHHIQKTIFLMAFLLGHFWYFVFSSVSHFIGFHKKHKVIGSCI